MEWTLTLRRTYCGSAPDFADLSSRWNLDPVLLGTLGLALVAACRLRAPQRAWGLAALGVAVVAFISPLCALTSALFAARSVHHVLVMAVLAPLLAMARPLTGPAAGSLTMPARFMALIVPLWLWHVPALYEAALGNVAIYWALQLLLLGGAVLFWSGLIRASAPIAMMVATAASAQAGLLGALLTFAARPLYAPHLTTTASYGIGPLADQQLAGLIMWVPGALVFAAFAAWVVVRGAQVQKLATA